MFAAAPSWVSQIIDAITSVFSDLGTAIINWIKTGFTTLFLDTNEGTTTLSNFAIYSFVLMGIALVCGLTYLIFNLVRRSR